MLSPKRADEKNAIYHALGAEKVCNTVVSRNKGLHCMNTKFSLTKSLKLVRLLD